MDARQSSSSSAAVNAEMLVEVVAVPKVSFVRTRLCARCLLRLICLEISLAQPVRACVFMCVCAREGKRERGGWHSARRAVNIYIPWAMSCDSNCSRASFQGLGDERVKEVLLLGRAR